MSQPPAHEPRDDHSEDALVVNLYPDHAGAPSSWSTRDSGSPSILFRRAGHGWVAHLDRHAVARAPTPEALAADVYGEYGVLAVLHHDPHAEPADQAEPLAAEG